MDSKYQTKWLSFWQCGKQASVFLHGQVILSPTSAGTCNGEALASGVLQFFFFLTRNQEMCCTCVHCIYLIGKPEQRPFNGILHAHLIKAKSCHLKTINHDRWDLMDLWVNVYYHCKFQVIFRKCKLTSSCSSRTDAFQQGSNGFQFS